MKFKKDKVYKFTGALVRKARLAHVDRLSARDVSRCLGVSYQFVTVMESGLVCVPVDRILPYCNLLDIDPEDFVDAISNDVAEKVRKEIQKNKGAVLKKA